MKLSSLLSSIAPPAAVCLLATAVLAAGPAVQAPQNPPGGGGMPGMEGMPPSGPPMEGGRPHKFPAPTNLKVLPKHLTGAQVRDVMHHWAGDLGVGCDTCHAEYPDHRKGPNGRPELDFPSDAKPQKKIARIMYRMTELDKKDYVAKAAAMDTKSADAAPLTCGTCHRGSLQPKAYVPPKREERGPHPEGPPPAGAPTGVSPQTN